MRYVALVALCAAGCAREPQSNEVDIGNAARAAQVSADNYVGDEVKPLPVAAPAAVVLPTPTPAPVAPSLAPDGSAQGAATRVEGYFALIEQGKYHDAWQTWDRAGAASGMSADAFAASFDKYAVYHASVGEPGRIDSGAGQRYVTVPVKVYGTLRTGQPFAMEGPITLHRAGDIDGATEAQRKWRIYESALKARPATAKPVAPTTVAP